MDTNLKGTITELKCKTYFLELGYNINPCTTSRLGSKQSKSSIEKAIMNNPNRIEVLQFDFHGNFIKEYDSIFTLNYDLLLNWATLELQYNKNNIYNKYYYYKSFRNWFTNLQKHSNLHQHWLSRL